MDVAEPALLECIQNPPLGYRDKPEDEQDEAAKKEFEEKK